MSGANVKPIVHRGYDGRDLVLPDDTSAVLRLSENPALTDHMGHDIVTASGTYGHGDEVARLTGLTTEQVVAAHTATPWRVGFGGFAPGFAYLIGGDGRLEVPRQSEPRTRVPAGSVALAGEFSAVYPRESPGGWQLIGHTSKDTAELWDVDRDPPALLRPGMWVQFRDVR